MASPAGSSEQRGGKRKSHRKSRNGCYQCKQRHTKCNETHPRCANCIRLDIECTWPSRERYSTTYPTPPESHGPLLVETPMLSSHLDPVVDTFGSEMSMADLRLLHHWTTKTCDDMSPEWKRRNAWRIRHVEIALDHPFLLRGLLAVAAVHRVLTDARADKSSLLMQADSHISKALATYRQNLEQPRPETAIPMFILSTVFVIYHLATDQLEAPEDPVNAMVHCFGLIQGVLVVINPNFDQLTSNPVFTNMVAPEPPSIDVAPIEEILRLKRLTETKKTPAGTIHIEAIDQLHQSYQRTRQCRPDLDRLAIAFSWTSSLSDPFTRLLAAHDPIAVLVISHFAALLAECQSSWWVCGLPQRIVVAAQKLLMSTPELLDYLDWPLQVISASTVT